MQVISLISLLMDKRLQSKLGIKSIDFSLMSFERGIEPNPITLKWEPSAIWSEELWVQGIKSLNKLVFPIMWSNAPKSVVQDSDPTLWTAKAFLELPFWATEPVPIVVLDSVNSNSDIGRRRRRRRLEISSHRIWFGSGVRLWYHEEIIEEGIAFW